jgi:cell division protein FtsB
MIVLPATSGDWGRRMGLAFGSRMKETKADLRSENEALRKKIEHLEHICKIARQVVSAGCGLGTEKFIAMPQREHDNLVDRVNSIDRLLWQVKEENEQYQRANNYLRCKIEELESGELEKPDKDWGME